MFMDEETVVKYSVFKETKQLFPSKYKLYLPTEKELIGEIEHEKEKYSRIVTRDEIAKNDFNISPSPLHPHRRRRGIPAHRGDCGGVGGAGGGGAGDG